MSSIRQRFENHEWRIIREAPMLAGLGVVAPEANLDTFGIEVATLAKVLAAAPYHYEHDPLVLAALMPNGDATIARRRHPTSPEAVLDHVKAAVRTVEGKAPEHASPYKDLVLDIASSVAQASRTSGRTPPPCSPREDLPFLRQLRVILHREKPQPTHAPIAPPVASPPPSVAPPVQAPRSVHVPWFGSLFAKLHTLLRTGLRKKELGGSRPVEQGTEVFAPQP
jgi:hypothetical protein